MTYVEVNVRSERSGDVSVSRVDLFAELKSDGSPERIAELLQAALVQVCAAYGIDPTTVLD